MDTTQDIFQTSQPAAISDNLPVSTEQVVNTADTNAKVFDFDSALKHGYTPDQILDEVGPELDKYGDIDGARKAGVPAISIISQLYEKQLVDGFMRIKEQDTIDDLITNFRAQNGVGSTGILSTPTTTSSKRFNDFANQTKALLLGQYQGILDLHELLGTDKLFTGGGSFHDISIQNMKQIDNLNKLINDKSFFSVSTLADFTTGLITLPLTYRSKALAALTEGSLAYNSARGHGLSKAQSAITGAAGGILTAGSLKLFDMWSKRGIPKKVIDLVEHGKREDLETYLNTMVKSADLNMGDELVGGYKKVPKNIFEQQKWLENIRAKTEAALTAETKKAIPKKSIDDVANLFNKSAEQLNKNMKSNTNIAYDAVEASINPANKYDYKALQEGILKKLRDDDRVPNEVMNFVKRELFYNEKHLLKSEKATIKVMNKYKDNILENQALLKTIDKGSKEFDNLRAAILSDADKVEKLQAQLPDLDVIGEKGILDLQRAINRKRFISGGAISTNDPQEQLALQLAGEYVDDFTNTTIKAQNPEFALAQRKARDTAKSYFKLFGSLNKGTKDVPELGKILTTDDTTKIAESLIDNEYKLNSVIKALKTQNPEIQREFVNTYMNKTMGKIVYKQDGIIDYDRFDVNSLATNLEKLVKDPEASKFITRHLGTEEFSNIESLYNISKGLNDIIKKLPSDGPLSKGVLNYISSADGVINTTGRALKVVYDGIGAIKNNTISKVPGMGWTSSAYKPQQKIMKRLVKLINKNIANKDGSREIIRLTRKLNKSLASHEHINAWAKSTKDVARSQSAANTYLMNTEIPKANELANKAGVSLAKAKELIRKLDINNYFDTMPSEIPNSKILVVPTSKRTIGVEMHSLSNNQFTVDTSNFTKNSGEGAKFYQKIWEYADNSGNTYVPEKSLTPIGETRLGINMLNWIKLNPHTKAFTKNTAIKVINNSANAIDLELQKINMKSLKTLSNEEVGIASRKLQGSGITYRALRILRDYQKGRLSIDKLLNKEI